jgi:preprotein translocase subunit SecY
MSLVSTNTEARAHLATTIARAHLASTTKTNGRPQGGGGDVGAMNVAQHYGAAVVGVVVGDVVAPFGVGSAVGVVGVAGVAAAAVGGAAAVVGAAGVVVDAGGVVAVAAASRDDL